MCSNSRDSGFGIRDSQGSGGYTFVELVIVATIILILASAIMPLTKVTVQRTREAELRAAAQVLGVREVCLLNYVDGDLDQAEAPDLRIAPIRPPPRPARRRRRGAVAWCSDDQHRGDDAPGDEHVSDWTPLNAFHGGLPAGTALPWYVAAAEVRELPLLLARIITLPSASVSARPLRGNPGELAPRPELHCHLEAA